MWFYGTPADKKGPVSMPQLQELARAGTLAPTTQVWTDGMPGWKPATQMPFLASCFNPNDSPGMNLLLPMGPQSGLAMAAGYVGLFSLLLWLIAPIGVILGVLGLRDIRANPGKHGKGRAITGIVCGGLGTIGLQFLLFAVILHHK